MERGLLAELNPHEEIALRRIAEGMVETKDVQKRHLERLKLLALVEVTEKDFRLTSLGQRRLSMLRR
jgi:hypothetical protein